MGYINKTLYIVWGMIQVMAMMKLAVCDGNTWIMFGLLFSNMGMMYLIYDLSEKVEETKE